MAVCISPRIKLLDGKARILAQTSIDALICDPETALINESFDLIFIVQDRPGRQYMRTGIWHAPDSMAGCRYGREGDSSAILANFGFSGYDCTAKIALFHVTHC